MPVELLLFDVNETLLDVAALRPSFATHLGGDEPMGEWFARLLHGSLVANETGRYRRFEEIGVEALLLVAAKREIALTREGAEDVVAAMRRLPAHPDVAAGLTMLAAAGYRLAVLTNGSRSVVGDQLRNAGIDGFFERAISVDEMERFKPAPQTYLMASVRLGVEVDRMLMVASHDWDVVGARSIGMPGAFVARPGSVWSLPDPEPDLVVSDLVALADRLGR